MLKVQFVDFWPGFNPEEFFLYKILKENFHVELSEQPDYLFYSVFGYEFLKYNCVRVFFTGENIRPDFNLCDYAFGFDWLTFQDRYYRMPLYRIYEDDWNTIINKSVTSDPEKELYCKKAFCNFIYSNGQAHPAREYFFKVLSQYKKIHSAGKFLNNVGVAIANKNEFQSQFKFSIAFENSSTLGYTTEKITQAMAVATIPIYWGNPAINQEFNEKAFVNCHSFQNFTEVIDRIKEIDEDDKKWCDMMAESWLIGDKVPRYLETEEVVNYLKHIFQQPKNQARRRAVYGATLNYEIRLRQLIQRMEKL